MGRRFAKQYKRVEKSTPTQTTSVCFSTHPIYFTKYLCALQLFVYVLDSFGFIDDRLLICDSRKRYQIWRLFTVSLVHDGILHLVSILIGEVIVCRPLEKACGTKTVALVFFTGNAVGEFMTSLFNTNPYLGAGASAGAAALVSAYIVYCILNPSRRSNWLLFYCVLSVFSELFVIFAPYCLKLICKSDPLICALLYRMGIFDIVIDVGSSSHFGGYVAGFLLGFRILKNDAPLSKWTLILRGISAIIAVCLFPFLMINYFLA